MGQKTLKLSKIGVKKRSILLFHLHGNGPTLRMEHFSVHFDKLQKVLSSVGMKYFDPNIHSKVLSNGKG